MVGLWLGLGAVGCDPADSRHPTAAVASPDIGEASGRPVAPAPSEVERGSGAPPPAPRPRLEGEPFASLPVERHLDAVVSLPVGADGPRPVVVATHGNYDRPEWQCQVWREIVRDRGFVLCPRGRLRADSPSPDDPRYTYLSNQHLEAEVDLALAALRDRYGPFVAGEDAVWAGFSLGAIMGVAIAGRRPGTFPRSVLVEGGYDKWSSVSARAFQRGGGERVLFACGQPSCTTTAKQAVKLLETAGAMGRVVESPNTGHNYDGPMAAQVAAGFEWVVEGDPRWDSPPETASAAPVR